MHMNVWMWISICTLLTAQPPQGEPLRVLPIGDSITAGAGNIAGGGYRKMVYEGLTAQGFQVDMLGSQNLGRGRGWDRDHEGHGGKTVLWFKPRIKKAVRRSNPDVVLVMLGTNDLNNKARRVEYIVNDLEVVIQRIREVAPNALILVSTVPPFPRHAERTKKYQAMIPDMVAKQQDPFTVFVDTASGIERSELKDGVHPNTKGYRKIADAWIKALVEAKGPKQ